MWQISISTSAEAEEAVALLLERHFGKAPSIYCDEATGARTIAVFAQKLPASAPKVSAELRDDLKQLREFGLDPSPGKIKIAPLPDKNWVDSWKHHFKPIEIDRALLVIPPWSKKAPRGGQKVVVINPGMSFGTGQHPTTYFCLQQLARARRPEMGQALLDIGTGSGILAIAAAKLGYAVEAFDFDPQAVRSCQQNIRRNRVFHKIALRQQDLTRLPVKSGKRYDVICANLVCDLLLQEIPKIHARMKPGGTLIVAGILKRQFDDLEKCLKRFDLTLQSSMTDKHWQSGQFGLSRS